MDERTMKALLEAVASGDPNSAAAEMYLHIYKFRMGVLEDMKEKAGAEKK